MSDSIEPFELLARRCATHGGRRAAENFIGGDPHEDGSPLDYHVWAARSPKRVILIDTGFGPDAAAARGRALQETPARLLASIGVDPARIEDVVITHLHVDHAGAFGDFPGARFHLEDSEMAAATGRCMCDAHLRRPNEVENVVDMVRLVYAGRVCFHESRADLAPGLSLHRIGGHSTGLQAVRVFTRRGWVVLASDASHHYANMRDGRPFPVVAEMLEGFRTLHALAHGPDHIAPGHDPLVALRYEPLSAQTRAFAVRLDREPR